MFPSLRLLATLRILLLALTAALLSACAGLPETPQPFTHALQRPEGTPLGAAVAGQAAPRQGASGLRLLVRGAEALAAREALALSASATLDLQYYILADDSSGRGLLALVAQAADRGVRVRLLVDDVHTGTRDAALAEFAAHPGIEVRVFNPFSIRARMGLRRGTELLLRSDRLNRRMHNKIMVADNAAAIVGGRNIGNAYFGQTSETAFLDLDVLAIGPVVKEASASFDAYWNSAWAVPVETFAAVTDSHPVAPLPEPRASDEGETMARALFDGTLAFEWGPARALWDLPEKAGGRDAAARDGVRMAPSLRALVMSARERVTIVSAYFVPGRDGVEQLAGLVHRGVTLSVLTNSLAATDVVAAHAGYAHYRTELARAGVVLHELRPLSGRSGPSGTGGSGPFSSRTSLHAKAFIIDGRTVVVGSPNADLRSAWLNTELVFVVESESLARSLEGLIDRAADERSHRVRWNGSRLTWERREGDRIVVLEDEPDTTAWRRLLSDLLWIVAPETSL